MKTFKIVGGVLVFLIAFFITMGLQPVSSPPEAPQKITVKNVEQNASGCIVIFSSPDGDFTIKDKDVASCDGLEVGQDATSAFT